MTKRALTPEEREELINAVLKEYSTINALPEKMRDKYHQGFVEMMDPVLQKVCIYPQGIPILKEKLIRGFRMVSPGKSVGIICGQSIGELNTQTTLNSFHATGIANRTVVQGVPRFLEIIDTNRSETQGTPFCTIYLNRNPQGVQAIRDIVGSSLVHHNFGGLYVSHVVKFEDEPLEEWHAPTGVQGKTRLCYQLNLELMYRYKIHLHLISERLQHSHPNLIVVHSPLHLGRIDVWCQEYSLSILENQIHTQLLQTKICGVDRIQNMFFIKQHGDSGAPAWTIQTDGSNLEEILNLSYVDIYRTHSNDIWETYNLFGIEAVRAYIVDELNQLMPTIHPSHITLLADRMTVSGRLRSISRYTRKHEQSSVLSKATFEETLSGFLRSALLQEKDPIQGSSASIICGKVPKVGTGMNDLMIIPGTR